ncbi:TetR family transcriptional regulator [Alkalilimnicola ehrlichii]|uniref:TetR family transcriptional regulator n=1 Tax=Alkalilimnicola ehrlichii TaxID=351052 RepID=A0A3E0WIY7_9GAMM|nr:TetR family transcriptional regulator [Alkalilimnicola ehrlichii]RFA32950.1 TetR family transcriptional regulator [Alkalilimnicola ehrlichii]
MRRVPEGATAQRIEAAVLRLFSQHEFHRVKLIEVAREARVSLQTIYKYYGDKETLVYVCLDRWLSKLTGRMIDHLRGIATYKDRLRKVYWVVMDFFESNPDVAQLIITSTYIDAWRRHDSFRQDELMGLLLKVLREGRDRGVLNEEVDETFLLDFMLGVIQRVVLMWVLRGREEPLTEQADIQFEMLWRAISKS